MFCGKPGVPVQTPQKHRKSTAPHYQLSFTVDGKSSSLFVKKEDLKTLRDCAKRYPKVQGVKYPAFKRLYTVGTKRRSSSSKGFGA